MLAPPFSPSPGLPISIEVFINSLKLNYNKIIKSAQILSRGRRHWHPMECQKIKLCWHNWAEGDKRAVGLIMFAHTPSWERNILGPVINDYLINNTERERNIPFSIIPWVCRDSSRGGHRIQSWQCTADERRNLDDNTGSTHNVFPSHLIRI